MKKLPTLILGLFFLGQGIENLKAQQEPQFTQFWNAKNYLNAATAGLNYRHQAIGLARWQWIGVNGAPEDQLATYSMKLGKIHGGIGVTYAHEKIGFSNEHRAKINYSYQMQLKNEGILSFGTAIGFNIQKFTPEWVTPTNVPDSSLPQSFTQTKFAADFGMAYSMNRFNCGLSVTQLTARKSSDHFEYSPHYFLFADYTFGKEEGFQFVPQLLWKTDLIFNSIDINVLVKYKSMYYIGATLRARDSFGFIGGVDIAKRYRISYSYDLTISKLNNGIAGGSHEIVLGFLLK